MSQAAALPIMPAMGVETSQMGAQSQPGVQLSTAEAGDRPAQVELYRQCFHKEDGRAVLGWRYDNCPHGKALSWIARSGSQVLASYACSPRLVLHRGDPQSSAQVGETGDVMTAPASRGRGVFSALDREAMRSTAAAGWPVIFGLPNRQSERLFTEKLGWHAVGRIRPWTFVLASDAGARRERLRAGRAASLAVPWSAWQGRRVRRRLRRSAAGCIRTSPLAMFPAEVDALALAVARNYPWMSRRDHAWLNWRFCQAPSGLFRALAAYLPEGGLVGYAVVQIPRGGEAVGYLVDLLTLDPLAQAALVEAACEHLQECAASVMRAWAIEGSHWERDLHRSGFRRGKARDHKTVIAYIHQPDHPLAQAAWRPSEWFFSDADRDDELVS